MITTAIKKEGKRAVQLRQMQQIGDYEMGFNTSRVSAFLGSLHRQRSQVDAGYVKALLGQPDAIGSRSTA